MNNIWTAADKSFHYYSLIKSIQKKQLYLHNNNNNNNTKNKTKKDNIQINKYKLRKKKLYLQPFGRLI